jgi:hypothetical protein
LPAPEKSSPLACIELDVPNERLLWGQRAITLTPKAFLLLRALVERPNQLLTRAPRWTVGRRALPRGGASERIGDRWHRVSARWPW